MLEDITALDIALRRNDTDWFEHLPPGNRQPTGTWLYCSALYCHTFSSGLYREEGVERPCAEAQMLETLLQARGAQYPAGKHNVGHLYKAPETLTFFIGKMTQPTV